MLQAERQVTLAEVRRTLRDLEDDQLRVRDAAEKNLVDMGPAALAFLPAVTPRTSGEMKVRLQRIKQALQQANISQQFQASTVSLSGKMKLSDALHQISQQSQNDIKLTNAEQLSSVEVTLEADRQPFWMVVEQIMSALNLRINAFGTTENELVLVPGVARSAAFPPVVNVGPFRLEVVMIRSLLPFNASIPGQLELTLQVTWEPRLKPVFMQLPMARISASMPDGGILVATNSQAAPEIPLNLGGCSTHIDLQLERPDRSSRRIDKLTGEFVIAVPSENHQYLFKKFGDGGKQTEKYGDVTVTLEGMRRNGAVYEMPLFIEFADAQGALESFRGWILSNEAYLLDADGARRENLGMNTYAVTPNSVGIAYRFQINDDPNGYQLVYESPASITRQTIVYELRDIELP